MKLILAIFGINFVCSSLGSFPLPFITPELCKTDEYFDPVCLRCKRCGSLRKDGQENYQVPSLDGSVCLCKSQYYLKDRKGPYDIDCSKCPGNKVPSLHKHGCIECDENIPYNQTTGLCEPCHNSITVDDGIKQYCISCLGKTLPLTTEISSCKTCSGNNEVHNETCSCLSNTTLSGGHCLPLVRNKESLFTAKFENGISVRSAYLVEHFNAAYHNCKEHNNVTACQVLANMCVMLLYRLDSRFTADSNACSEFVTLMNTQKTICTAEGVSFGLWILYGSDTQSEMHKTDVPNRFTSNMDLSASQLQFVVVTYDLSGKLVKMKYIKSKQLHPCGALKNTRDIPFSFGTSTVQKCEVLIQELWDSSELLFYELYLVSGAMGSNNSKMYPVPVLIRNMMINGEFINKDDDISKWQLAKRFFISDHISGIEAGTTINMKHQQPLSKVFRYASDVALIITARNGDNPGSIFPPLLVISYEETSPDDYIRNKKVSVKFSVSYEMDQSESERGVSIAVGILSTVAVAWTLVQTWSWFRRAGKHAVDILTSGKFIVFLCGNLSTVIFVVVFFASLNWFVVFKMQDVIHLILPNHNQEKFLGTYLGISFAMKAIEVIHLLVIQCNTNIFFVDWERPRNRSVSVSNRFASTSNSATSASAKLMGEPSAAGSVSKSISGKTTPDKLSSEMAGISIWRTYFVANEWAEIQTMRKVNLSFQLFGTIFFLKVVGLEELTFRSPLSSSSASEVQHIVPYSTCCRFAIGAAVYLALAFFQIAFRKGFYERFIEDKLQQYVDLCSVSNVSVFILVAKRFGYYIHGRSAHGKADVNMREMHELLRREEEDLCGHRGLLPNTEQQTFLMALPIGVYEQFKRLLEPLTTYSQAADRMQGVGGRLAKVDIDKVVSTYHTMNKFLAGFIEHAFKDLDYIVKDKVLLETLLDVELLDSTDRGYFYNDSGHSFDSVLFFGNENILLLFDVLLFCVIDVASTNYVLAAVLTYVVGKIIQALRLSAGRRNVVRKALVDERFLT